MGRHHALRRSHHLRLSELLGGDLKHVDKSRVLHDSHKRVDFGLPKTLLLHEILYLVQIEAHLSDLLHEQLTRVRKVGGDLTRLLSIRPHRELLLDQAALLDSARIGQDGFLAHKVEQLARDFVKYLLRE